MNLHVLNRVCVAILPLAAVATTHAAPSTPETPRIAATEAVEWQAERPGDIYKASHAGVTVRLSGAPARKDDPEPITRIEIAVPGGRTAKFAHANAFAPGGTLQFAELDITNRYPEVIFSTYSGGAHCCYETHVYWHNGKAWSDIGSKRGVDGFGGDGIPGRAKDVDGDGRAEMLSLEGTFNYAFSSYAGSRNVTRIHQYDGRRWQDVTRNPAFFSENAIDPKEARGFCRQPDSNGFWAWYVAAGDIIGRRQEAWDLMLACYDRKSNWGLCEGGELPDGKCKAPHPGFPAVLKKTLGFD